MADRPILFSAPMIRALFNGRKSQTRRVLKPQPDKFCRDMPNSGAWSQEHWESMYCGTFPDGSRLMKSFPYAPGDRLWVRETHKALLMGDFPVMWYRADDSDKPISANQYFAMESKGWRSPIHMPRWASRLTLVVTDVRVQRLQMISDADAVAEGVERCGLGTWKRYHPKDAAHPVLNPQHSFCTLWHSIHGVNTWKANPWVVALTFDVHRCNIDQLEKEMT